MVRMTVAIIWKRVVAMTLAVLLIGGALAADASAAPAPHVVAVCPDRFFDALRPWVLRREAEGLRVAVVPSDVSAAGVLERIRAAADPATTRYIVLVGDCRLVASDGAADATSEVPTHYRAADVTRPWGTTDMLPGDAPYGDLDGDRRPDATVGRLPVDTPDQLTRFIDRIIAREESSDFGPWRETVQLTAGVGGFGMIADAAIESVARSLITGSLPASTRTRVTYASPGSPFNPGLDRFHDAVVQQYCEGARFWVYAGHGWVTELDRVPQSDAGRPVLRCDDVHLLQCNVEQAPIALLFACYTGAFDANEDCLAERMLLADCGPVAVLAGSRVTLPYGNATAATALIRSVYAQRAPRLGDAWLTAMRELATASADDPAVASRRGMIETLATLLSPTATRLDAERREHAHLYNWLGDPTMRLVHGSDLGLTAPATVAVDQAIEVRGQADAAGRLTLALHRPVGSVPDGAREVDRYASANDTEVAEVQLQLQQPGPFVATLSPPAGISGVFDVVGHLEAVGGYAVGAARVMIPAAPEMSKSQ